MKRVAKVHLGRANIFHSKKYEEKSIIDVKRNK